MAQSVNRTGLENEKRGRWFDPWLLQYFFPRIDMIVFVRGFIPLSPLSIVSTIEMWESSQWVWKNIVQGTWEKNFRKAFIGELAVNEFNELMLKDN